jgi:short-subunit dehydrogenase
VLAANGGGATVNVLSIAARVNMPFIASYSASKAAAASLTQGLRGELRHHGTHVVGVYPGPVDTDMAASLPVDKVAAADVARAALDAVESGTDDVYPDPYAADTARRLAADAKAVERTFGDLAPKPRS